LITPFNPPSSPKFQDSIEQFFIERYSQTYDAIQVRKAMKDADPLVAAQYHITLPDELDWHNVHIELLNHVYTYDPAFKDVTAFKYEPAYKDATDWWAISALSIWDGTREMPAIIAYAQYLTKSNIISMFTFSLEDRTPQPITLANVGRYSKYKKLNIEVIQRHLNVLLTAPPILPVTNRFEKKQFKDALSFIYTGFAQAREESRVLYHPNLPVIIHIDNPNTSENHDITIANALIQMVGAHAANVDLVAHTVYPERWKEAEKLFRQKVWPGDKPISLDKVLENLKALKLVL